MTLLFEGIKERRDITTAALEEAGLASLIKNVHRTEHPTGGGQIWIRPQRSHSTAARRFKFGLQ